ncbi:GTPase-associated system all-helical protein GASH [Collimonas humicola]|uniref:GTPase-associated system all-helical protein GASH n=1 Tax=Collimonas humicola TaxID=2825886 RepID=UPI001B8B82FE|nr:GTPase-associated system all-helical protein GASH [Collimonas humicola]
MTDDDVLPMHADFARWHAAIQLEENLPRRKARWEGVATIVDDADRGTVEVLIRLAFKTRQVPVAEGLLPIRQAFKDADDTFEMSGNDRELQVLASVCLAVLMERGGDVGAATALSVTTTALGGARTADLPMDIRLLAENAINRISAENRERPALTRHTAVPVFDFEKAVAKVREIPNWDGVAQAFTLAADAARSAVKIMTQRQSTMIEAMDKLVRIQDEELQMLWWLMGQRSWDHDCSFEAVPVDLQPLAFAKELAESTQFLPGPPSVKALLSRAGLKDRKKIAIPTAINAAGADWLKTFIEEELSPVSTPLHFAIQRQIETGAGEAWVPGWAAATGVSATHAISPLMFGMSFYRERLLLLFE